MTASAEGLTAGVICELFISQLSFYLALGELLLSGGFVLVLIPIRFCGGLKVGADVGAQDVCADREADEADENQEVAHGRISSNAHQQRAAAGIKMSAASKLACKIVVIMWLAPVGIRPTIREGRLLEFW